MSSYRKFTFPISSPDEFLVDEGSKYGGIRKNAFIVKQNLVHYFSANYSL